MKRLIDFKNSLIEFISYQDRDTTAVENEDGRRSEEERAAAVENENGHKEASAVEDKDGHREEEATPIFIDEEKNRRESVRRSMYSVLGCRIDRWPSNLVYMKCLEDAKSGAICSTLKTISWERELPCAILYESPNINILSWIDNDDILFKESRLMFDYFINAQEIEQTNIKNERLSRSKSRIFTFHHRIKTNLIEVTWQESTGDHMKKRVCDQWYKFIFEAYEGACCFANIKVGFDAADIQKSLSFIFERISLRIIRDDFYSPGRKILSLHSKEEMNARVVEYLNHALQTLEVYGLDVKNQTLLECFSKDVMRSSFIHAILIFRCLFHPDSIYDALTERAEILLDMLERRFMPI